MTAEKLVLLHKEIWATICHLMWKIIEGIKQKHETEKLTKAELGELEKLISDDYGLIRAQIYARVIDEPNVTREQARRIILMS